MSIQSFFLPQLVSKLSRGAITLGGLMAKRISLYGNVTGQLTRVSQDDMDVELVVKGTGDVGETPDDIEIVDASDEDGNPIPRKKWDDITFDKDDIEWEEPDAPEPDLEGDE